MEDRSLAKLSASLAGARGLSKKLLLKLDKLEKKLSSMDTKVSAVQDATDNYLVAKDNISAVLSEVEKTNEFFRVVKQVEPVVKAGILSGQRDQFLNAISRLAAAQTFFSERKKDIKAAPQMLKAVGNLLKRAIAASLEDLEAVLALYGKSVQRVDGGLVRAVSPDSSPAIPPEGLLDVKKLCETLEDCECSEHFVVYKKVRMGLVQKELRACEAASHTAWEELLQDVPYQKGTHPLKGYLSLSVELLRGEQLLWGATLSSSDASIEVFLSIADVIIVEIQRTLTPTLIDEDSSDGSKTTTELSAATPLVVQHSSAAAAGGGAGGASGSITVQHSSTFSARKLFRMKGFSLNLAKPKPLIFRSIPDKINRQCNLFLIRLDTLEIFLSRYEDMITLCLPDTRVESLAAESLMMMRDAIVESCVESVSQVIAATAENTKKQRRHSNAGTGSSSGSGTGNSASSSTEEQESLTCDLQPITGNILYCCKELMHFTRVYGKMHELAVEIGVRVPASAPTLTDLIAVLLQNLVELLMKRAEKLDPVGKTKVSRSLNLKGHALFESGERDADDYLLWARKHLFLVNNLYSLSAYIQEKRKDMQMYTNAAATGMGSMASSAGRTQGANSVLRLLELSDQVESRLAKERERFCATVAEAMSMTPAEMSEFAAEYEPADKNTRHRLLKAKFSLFTSGMDALLAQQGELRVSVAGLRDALGDQLLDTIYPFYSKLYENYSTVAFSKKHMNDYLRFSPRDVERSLKYFFGKG